MMFGGHSLSGDGSGEISMPRVFISHSSKDVKFVEEELLLLFIQYKTTLGTPQRLS
jgi:hypothetical protein